MFRVREIFTVCAVSIALISPPAGASVAKDQLLPGPQASSTPSVPAADSRDPATVEAGQRDAVLPREWRQSQDLTWTTTGDADGLHVLVAEAKNGYTWRTAATLSEPGLETDLWIGNACVTGSGNKLVVVYAPRTFTNKAELFLRGGFTAIVDLRSGAVLKLPIQSSLAYYNPGCGVGEQAILTQAGDEDLGATRLARVDTATAALSTPVKVAGQVTSAVPDAKGIVAASGSRVIRVQSDGSMQPLARSSGTPFALRPDAAGGVWFMDHAGDAARVRRVDHTGTRSFAKGGLDEVGLAAGAGGRIFLTGTSSSLRPLPSTVARLEIPADSSVSTTGQIAVLRTESESVTSARMLSTSPNNAQPVRISTRVVSTGKDLAFTVHPSQRQSEQSQTGRELSPNLDTRASAAPTAAGDPGDPVDTDRSCSVPRGDVRTQVHQPTPHQVEWAVDMLAQGRMDLNRPANWKGSGLPAYAPLEMFPLVPLAGGGRIPAQVLLGITAQESNMWQASRHTVEGLAGNPLIGNYYGIPFRVSGKESEWDVDWKDADCGYGVTQVTDGMRLAGREKPDEKPRPPLHQRAIAVDYAANLAAGAQILAEKWNEQAAYGMKVHEGDPSKLENWFMAVWAYNSGFHPRQKAGEPWGLGWMNNPANAPYPINRRPFLHGRPSDASHPEDWSYPEKVMGWAAHSIGKTTGKNGAGFQPAWWRNTDQQLSVKPPNTLFCVKAANDCDQTQKFVPDDPSVLPTKPGQKPEPASHCGHINPATGKYDLKCWWHDVAWWKDDCEVNCGNEKIRFDAGVHPNPPDVPVHNLNCQTEDLPSNVLIVDNVSADVPAVASAPCPRRSDGSFRLDFERDAKTGDFLSKVDFHQIAGGFGGHFWFSHTRDGEIGQRLRVNGEWRLNRELHGWARVMVHMPNHGAHTQQARYTVHTADGAKHRTLLQRTEENRWVPLGAFRFSGVPAVDLTSITGGKPDGTEDIAFDAIAFQPLPGKPQHQIVTIGDSFAAGEGASPASGGKYYPESDRMGLTNYQNACHRSYAAWSRKARLPGSQHTVGYRTDIWDPTIDYHLLACSGAQTHNLLPSPRPGEEPIRNAFGRTAEGKFREPPQLDKGFLDADTTLVPMTIGGNDAEFTDVLTDCFVRFSCQEHHDLLVRERILNRVVPSIRTALEQVAKAAPNAKIVVMGYVKIFTASCDQTSQPDQTAFFHPESSEAEWMGRMAVFLNDQIAALIKDLQASPKIDVHFADPIASFEGKSVCGDPEAVNAGVLKITQGEGEKGGFPGFNPVISQQSYHPNEIGTSILGDVLSARLPQIGYGRSG